MNEGFGSIADVAREVVLAAVHLSAMPDVAPLGEHLYIVPLAPPRERVG